MPETYVDRYDVPATNNQLVLYKRSDLDSDAWWFRAKIEGRKGYIRRSTRETERVLAERVATDEWLNLRQKHGAGLSLTVKLVRDVIDDFLEEMTVTKQEQRAKYQRNTWYRYMDGYFGEHKVSELTDTVIEGYWNYRLGFYTWGDGVGRSEVNKNRNGGSKTTSSNNIKPQPSYGTLRAEASIINEFLAWCYKDKQGYIGKKYVISARSAFKKNEQIALNRRPNFLRDEWRRIARNLESYADNTGAQKAERANAWHLRKRKMFRAYVMLLASTGLRVGEARYLRWQDIDTKGEVLRVNVRGETSKVRKNRTAFSHSDTMNKIMDWWRDNTEFSGAEDLVFYNVDTDGNQQTCDVSTNFKTFLRSINVKGKNDGMLRNADGEARTLYSLRHTYATMRLEEGVEVYALAKVMGTGVTQIEKHYGHVATERLMKEVIKGGSKKDTQQKRDLEYAADLITKLRAGDTTLDIVTQRLADIANVTAPVKRSKNVKS